MLINVDKFVRQTNSTMKELSNKNKYLYLSKK